MIEDKKIKNSFKEIFFFLLPILIVLVFLIPVPYYIDMGGGVIKLNNKISIENEKENGYYGALYVRETKGTILTYLLSYIIPSFDREKINDVLIENESKESYDYREKLFFTSSLDNATKIAFEKAGKDVKISSSKFYIIYIDKASKTELKTSDEIIEIDGKSFNTYDEMLDLLNTDKESVLVTVIRDNKKLITKNYFIEIEGSKKLGIVISNEIKYSSDPKVNFDFKGSEAGSSGGLMISLSIYDKLIDNNLTNGKKIMGTGSIDSYGNVEEISGIKYKLMAANKKKADLVFVPFNNYEEAKKEYDEKGYKFDLVAVKTFDDAVKYLKEH